MIWKTLLVLLCVMFGSSSAWAGTVTTIYERGTTNEWADADLTDWSVSSTSTYLTYSINGGLYLENTSPSTNFKSSYSTTKTISPTANSIVRMTAVIVCGYASGRTSSYDYVTIGGAELRVYGQAKTAQVYIDGTAQGSEVTATRGGTYTFNIEINQATGSVTYSVSGGATITEASTTTTTAISNVVIGHSRGGSEGIITSLKLTNISISEEAQVVTTADYTINYKLGENIVKTVASTSIIGAEITADVAVDGEGTYEGNHYVITAAEAPSMTLVADAASNVLNVPVRAPYTATLTVTTTIGGEAQTPVVTNLTETDDKVCAWSYAYPMYVKYNNVYYIADNTETFGEDGSFTDGESIEKSVSYTNADANVVFFSEAEATPGTNYSYSNGGTGYVAAQNKRDRGISVGTLAAGGYEFIVKITAANKRSVVIRQSTNDPLATVGTSNEDTKTGVKKASLILDATVSNLYINGANSGTEKTNQSEDFDYVIVKKLGSISPTFAEGYNYRTFASEFALDFKHATGVSAYYAEKISDGKVVMTNVETVDGSGTVAANTGLFLKKTADEISVPIVVSGSDLSTINSLFQGLGAGVGIMPETNYSKYVFGVKDDEVAFFKIGSTPAQVATDKAYLKVSSPASARLSIVFADEEEENDATGISNVAAQKKNDGVYYNLSGQRVNLPAKGLYIQNGKKVIVK